MAPVPAAAAVPAASAAGTAAAPSVMVRSAVHATAGMTRDRADQLVRPGSELAEVELLGRTGGEVRACDARVDEREVVLDRAAVGHVDHDMAGGRGQGAGDGELGQFDRQRGRAGRDRLRCGGLVVQHGHDPDRDEAEHDGGDEPDHRAEHDGAERRTRRCGVAGRARARVGRPEPCLGLEGRRELSRL